MIRDSAFLDIFIFLAPIVRISLFKSTTHTEKSELILRYRDIKKRRSMQYCKTGSRRNQLKEVIFVECISFTTERESQSIFFSLRHLSAFSFPYTFQLSFALRHVRYKIWHGGQGGKRRKGCNVLILVTEQQLLYYCCCH